MNPDQREINWVKFHEVIMDGWGSIDQEYIDGFIEFMPRTIEAVHKAERMLIQITDLKTIPIIHWKA